MLAKEKKGIIRFESECLVSKWGFGDGDMFDDFLFDHGFDIKIFKTVLAEVVIRHVIPALDQKEIELINVEDWNWTNHNPIRARRVNGIEVDDYGKRPNPTLTPEFIDVEEEAILVIAREVGLSRS